MRVCVCDINMSMSVTRESDDQTVDFRVFPCFLDISIFCGSKDLSPSRKLQRTGQLGREKYPRPYPIRLVDK